MLTIPNWEKVGSPGYRVELTLNQVNQLVQPLVPVDLTSLVISWGKIRSSVKRISKAPEISGVSLTLDNSRNDIGPLLNFRPNQDYLNDLMIIGIGVRGSDGTFDPVVLTSGLLKSIRDSGAVKSIYTIQDPQSVLRNRSAAERESQHLLSQSSAQIISQLFDYAGFGDWVGESFGELAVYERAVGEIIQDFEITKGTWWSNIERALSLGKGNIRFSAGEFQYYRRFPSFGEGVAEVTELIVQSGERSIVIDVSSEHIQNRIDWFDTGAVKGVEQNIPSQNTFGVLAGERTYDFGSATVSAGAAEEEIDLLSNPAIDIALTTDIRAAILQPGDLVGLTGVQFDQVQVTIVEMVDIDEDNQSVRLRLSRDTSDVDWLQADNSQLLDTGVLIW